MTQLAIRFPTADDADRERRARVWAWCAHLANVEADAISYAWPPRQDDAARVELEMLTNAGRAFVEKAERVLGRELDSATWQDALAAFSDAPR